MEMEARAFQSLRSMVEGGADAGIRHLQDVQDMFKRKQKEIDRFVADNIEDVFSFPEE